MIYPNKLLKNGGGISGAQNPASYQDDNILYVDLFGNKPFYDLFFSKLSLLYNWKTKTIDCILINLIKNYPIKDNLTTLFAFLSIINILKGHMCPLNKILLKNNYFIFKYFVAGFSGWLTHLYKLILGDICVPFNFFSGWTPKKQLKVTRSDNGVFFNIKYYCFGVNL